MPSALPVGQRPAVCASRRARSCAAAGRPGPPNGASATRWSTCGRPPLSASRDGGQLPVGCTPSPARRAIAGKVTAGFRACFASDCRDSLHLPGRELFAQREVEANALSDKQKRLHGIEIAYSLSLERWRTVARRWCTAAGDGLRSTAPCWRPKSPTAGLPGARPPAASRSLNPRLAATGACRRQEWAAEVPCPTSFPQCA